MVEHHTGWSALCSYKLESRHDRARNWSGLGRGCVFRALLHLLADRARCVASLACATCKDQLNIKQDTCQGRLSRSHNAMPPQTSLHALGNIVPQKSPCTPKHIDKRIARIGSFFHRSWAHAQQNCRRFRFRLYSIIYRSSSMRRTATTLSGCGRTALYGPKGSRTLTTGPPARDGSQPINRVRLHYRSPPKAS